MSELDVVMWDKRNSKLVKEMELFLRKLVERGCRTCDKNGYGYTDYSETGLVCKHMIDARYKAFKKRIDAELKTLAEITGNNLTAPSV